MYTQQVVCGVLFPLSVRLHSLKRIIFTIQHSSALLYLFPFRTILLLACEWLGKQYQITEYFGHQAKSNFIQPFHRECESRATCITKRQKLASNKDNSNHGQPMGPAQHGTPSENQQTNKKVWVMPPASDTNLL